jgi:predicted dehydrogenase
MNELRVGIIGSGFMGRTHSEAIAHYVNGARLICIAGGQDASRIAADYGVDFINSVEELVESDCIDAVIIATPQVVHAQQTILAARQGKHVLVEKPVTISLDQCDAMITACREAGVNLMVAQSQRYRKGNQIAKEILHRGEIGRILMIEESQINTGGLASLPAWQSKKENLGTLLGYGVHNIDRLRWFLEDEVQWIVGITTNYTEDVLAEASSMMLMKFRKGTSASLWCTFEAPQPGLPASGFRVRIVGEKGLLDVDSFGLTQIGKGDHWEVLYEQPKFNFRTDPFSPIRMEAYHKQDQEFIDSILEKRQPAVTGEDGRAAVEIALAAYESSRLGRVVHLPIQQD